MISIKTVVLKPVATCHGSEDGNIATLNNNTATAKPDKWVINVESKARKGAGVDASQRTIALLTSERDALSARFAT
jgi:hypothetical protein